MKVTMNNFLGSDVKDEGHIEQYLGSDVKDKGRIELLWKL